MSNINKTDKFKERVKNKKGAEYVVIGRYVSMKKKIKMKHLTCAYEWETSPDNFLRTKKGCPKCSGNARGSQTTFEDRVKELCENEYAVLGEYINARTGIELRHNNCGYEFIVTPYSFTGLGTRCPSCSGVLKRTDSQFKALVEDLEGDGYVFLEKYVNNNTKIPCRHKTCGYVWSTTPANFLDNGARCPKCAKNAPLTNKIFQSRVRELHGEEYKILEAYKGFLEPLLCKHSCGNEWKISPSNLLRGRRCPRCVRESKGEELVRGVLDNSNVPYVQEKAFEGCRYKKELRFDFYLPTLDMVIEYDGEQHFRPVNFGGKGDEGSLIKFHETLKRDEIKNKYCTNEGIKMLRIPYHLGREKAQELILKSIQSRSKAESPKPKIRVMI